MPNLSGKGNQREIGKIPKGKGNQIQFDVTKFRSDFSIGDKTSDNSFPVVRSVVAKGQAIVFVNPFLPTVAFSQPSSNICCPRD